jgi:hypothetical protein
MAIANQGTAKVPPSQAPAGRFEDGPAPEVKHAKVDDRAPMKPA